MATNKEELKPAEAKNVWCVNGNPPTCIHCGETLGLLVGGSIRTKCKCGKTSFSGLEDKKDLSLIFGGR